MSITSDFSEVNRLVVDLSKAAAKVLPEVRAVIQKGSLNIKNEMVADARGSQHFRAIAPSISYDTELTASGITSEIGPDKARYGGAGALGNIAYFGGVNGGGGTLDIDKPLRNEEPRLLRALGDLGGELL